MDELRYLSILIVMAPLIGATVVGVLGNKVNKTIAHCLTCSLITVSFLASSYILYGFIYGQYKTWDSTIYVWATSGDLKITVGFLLDKLSVLMMTVVTFVSLMVHIYSIGYMQDDPGYQRFFSYISLFTFAMLMLVMANNVMQLFFGWEAVGLASYLLIGFWYKRPSAIFASLKAFIINRIGDFGFILGIAAIVSYCGAVNYKAIFAAVPSILANPGAIDLVCICLLIGAMAKSAQIPLHVWLPDSMEGPTPISALIHAATMVTAGIFMVARMSPLFENSDLALSLMLVIGAMTCFLMGILAVVQADIKRIIAYSTLSQLGYMFVALGASAYSVAIFHLITHAFFKSLLFLGAGSVIVALHHEQNIFKMGNLRKYMPITCGCMLVATLAIIGFPGTSGFFSKHLIVETVQHSTLAGASLAYWAVLLGVFITSLYSFRLLFLVFYTSEGMPAEQRTHLQESPPVIWVPLILLALPSIVLGMIMLSSILNGFFAEAIYVLPQHDAFNIVKQENFTGRIGMLLHGLSSYQTLMMVLGFFVAWLSYIKYPKIPVFLAKDLSVVHNILIQKYGFDLLNERIIAPIVRKLSFESWRVGDKLCIDGFIINGSAQRIGAAATMLKKLQTGYLYHYVFFMVVGLLSLLLWMFIIRGV